MAEEVFVEGRGFGAEFLDGDEDFAELRGLRVEERLVHGAKRALANLGQHRHVLVLQLVRHHAVGRVQRRQLGREIVRLPAHNRMRL